jgi:hypothetical protein
MTKSKIDPIKTNLTFAQDGSNFLKFVSTAISEMVILNRFDVTLNSTMLNIDVGDKGVWDFI